MVTSVTFDTLELMSFLMVVENTFHFCFWVIPMFSSYVGACKNFPFEGLLHI